VNAGQVFLVARDTIERFGDHYRKLARPRVAHQPLPAHAVQGRGAGYRTVFIEAGDGQTFARAQRAAERDLILDRSVGLLIGAKPSVNCRFHGPPREGCGGADSHRSRRRGQATGQGLSTPLSPCAVRPACNHGCLLPGFGARPAMVQRDRGDWAFASRRRPRRTPPLARLQVDLVAFEDRARCAAVSAHRVSGPNCGDQRPVSA
jgi:hypothetical protein